MTAIVNAIKIISALIDLLKVFQRFLSDARKKQIEEHGKKIDEAVDQMEKAKTEKEFDDAQKKIVDAKSP